MKRSPLKRSTKPIARSPIKKRGKAAVVRRRRTKKEFARIYGSKARVEWVKSQKCIWCFRLGDTQNAHVVTGGMGRKADYRFIAPLCSDCHKRYDQHLMPFDNDEMRASVRLAAHLTESRWLVEDTETT